MYRFLFTALLAGALALLVSANPEATRSRAVDNFEAERAAATKELITNLEAYAEWCTSKKNWIERNRALESVLTFDPGNMSAKRGLGWQQVADGVWEPPKEPKPAKNFDPAAMKDAPARYSEAIRPWRDHMLQLLESHKDEVTATQRASVLEEIIAVDPNDEFVHKERGEEHAGQAWVLSDTVRAKSRRAEIKDIVKKALESAPKAADFVPSAGDMLFKLDWKVSVSTDRVRVLSTGDRAEALHVLQVLHAAQDVFNGVFATSASLGPEFTIYLLCDPAAKKTFIENLPGASAAQRSSYALTDGSGLQGSNNGAWWSALPERRLDGVTRHCLGAMFQAEFGLTINVSWAWEGLGLYLTREMIGTRYSLYITVPPSAPAGAAGRAGPDWTKKLLTPGTNWMNEGYRLLRAGDATNLTGTLDRPMNKMTPQDLFVAYVVCAYLLEAQPQRLPDVLRLVGNKGKTGQKAATAWTNALKMDMDVFYTRLDRWLGERK
jgi:hypothetical protein